MLKITKLRFGSQIIFGSIIMYLGYLGIRMIEWKKVTLVLPTLTCYYLENRIASCYIHSLQELLTAGWKVYYANLLIPTMVFLVLGLIFGRAWCAWVCPLGLLQDIFIRIRKSLTIGYYNLSENLKQASVIVKWFFVIALLLVSLGIGIPKFILKTYQYDLFIPFCQLCPGRQVFPLLTGNFHKMLAVDDISTLTMVMSYLAIAVFLFYVVTTAFIRRMWCRLCPMGVILGLLNKVSLLSLRKEGKRCTKCGICQRSCPVQVNEVYEEKEKERVTPIDCTLCFRCVEMCPQDNALKAGLFKSPIVKSTYKRFLKSGAVRLIKSKRTNLDGQQK